MTLVLTTTADAATYTPAPGAPTADAIQSPNNTASQIRSMVNDRWGTKALADEATVQRGKVDFYALNEARAKAAASAATQTEKVAAKSLLRRVIGSAVLPRAAGLLGPIGWGVTIGTTGYTLCTTVIKCFRSKPSYPVPANWGNATPAVDGKVLGLSVSGDGAAEPGLPNYTRYRMVGTDGVAALSGSFISLDTQFMKTGSTTPFGELKDLQGVFFTVPSSSGLATPGTVTGVPDTVRQISTIPYTDANGTVVQRSVLVADLTDALDVEQKAGCTSGEQCATTKDPTDAQLGAGLWDSVVNAGDADTARYLARQMERDMVTKVTVPAVGANETAASYVAKLQAAGLGFVRTVVSTAAADVTKPAGAVLDIDPAAGATVESGATVKIRENPDPLPVVVLAPAANETYDQYIARLRAKGYTGTARRVLNSDATLDPKRGPNAVTGASPDVGSRIAPGDEVVVRVNPENAPGTAAGGGTGGTGGGSTGTGLNAIDFSPLNKATPCNSFPFGVPCWVVNALGGFNATGKAPSMSMALPFGQRVSADFTWWAPIAAIYKPVMLFASYLLLAWAFMRLTLSGNDGD